MLKGTGLGRGAVVVALAAVVLLAACGDDDGGSDAANDEESATADESDSDDATDEESAPADDGGDDADSGSDGGVEIDPAGVCALLSDDEIQALLGAPLSAEPNDYPDGSPFPGCSWSIGRLLVQVDQRDELVLAPGVECDPVDVGDEAVSCPGSVQFVSGGTRVIVSTIEDVTPEQLAAIAATIEPKL